MKTIEDEAHIISLKMIRAVPDDDDNVVSNHQGEPLVDTDSLAGQAFLNICKRIMGEPVPLLDLNPQRGLLVRLSDFLKRA